MRTGTDADREQGEFIEGIDAKNTMIIRYSTIDKLQTKRRVSNEETFIYFVRTVF